MIHLLDDFEVTPQNGGAQRAAARCRGGALLRFERAGATLGD